MTIKIIAQIAYEADRAYCESMGDFTQSVWDNTSDDQKRTWIGEVVWHLNSLRSGIQRSPEESHTHWLDQRKEEGWKYGKVKNDAAKEDPNMLPFNELQENQRVKDFLISKITEAFYLSHDNIN